jgi:hypothetical protein
VKKISGKHQMFVGPLKNRIGFGVQAYADNVMFISKDTNWIREMLGVLEDFAEQSRMEVNVKKCAIA